MNFTIAGIALLAALASGAWGSYKVTSLHYEHVIDQAEKKHQADIEAANQRADNSASDYEVWKSIQRPKTITVTREVERAVQADADCSSKPLPPSLRDALTAAGAAANQPSADSPMPAASSAGTFDLGRPRDGLLRSFGRAGGLSSPTQGAQ